MCRAALADACRNEFRAECAVLVAVVQEGLAENLISSSGTLPKEVLLDRLLLPGLRAHGEDRTEHLAPSSCREVVPLNLGQHMGA